MILAVEAANTVFILSTIATSSIEEVAEAAPKAIKWFQLYVYFDRSVTLNLIRRAEKAGFKALVLTVDTPMFGDRRCDVRNKFSLPKHLRYDVFHIILMTVGPKFLIFPQVGQLWRSSVQKDHFFERWFRPKRVRYESLWRFSHLERCYLAKKVRSFIFLRIFMMTRFWNFLKNLTALQSCRLFWKEFWLPKMRCWVSSTEPVQFWFRIMELDK